MSDDENKREDQDEESEEELEDTNEDVDNESEASGEEDDEEPEKNKEIKYAILSNKDMDDYMNKISRDPFGLPPANK